MNTVPDFKYQASSPDENALVKAAKDMGFFFHVKKKKDSE
jgi:magnesium-transporting ATPase (P-type)